MNKLTRELENRVGAFFGSRTGLLVAICEADDVDDVGRRLDERCNRCAICLAIISVSNIGEFDWSLKGRGLFAVGILAVDKPELCPVLRMREEGKI